MGLPQAPREENSSNSSSKTLPQLPPEALALATKLFDYARHGQTPELLQYIQSGIPSNLTNHKGDTFLMLAAYHGHLSTVRMLVENGADMDVLNDRGQSPVAGAVFKGYDDVVRYMAENGADLAKGQPDAVQCARMFGRRELLDFFGVGDEVVVEGPGS